MNIYKYNYKESKDNYGLNINIKYPVDLIKYLLDFSILFLSVDKHELICEKTDELEFGNIYLIKKHNKYYILTLFTTKYFIISTPLQFNTSNNMSNIFFNGKKIKIIDLEIFKYLIKTLEEKEKENTIVYSIDKAINDFKIDNDNNEEIDYNLEEKDLEYIFIKLLNYSFYYSRYDYDKKNEKGYSHPLNHIDFAIENSLKLGLYNKITPHDFIDLNLHEEIYYISRNNKLNILINKFYNSISKLFK